MCPKEIAEPRSTGSRLGAVLTWLGGGEWPELGERHERSTHVIAGVVVLLSAALACFVATLAVVQSTRWPIGAIIPLTCVFGMLVGAVSRAIASGPTRGWPGVAGRAAVAVAVGVVVGELAAVVIFSGSIDRRLDERATRAADSAPAVAQAATDLDRTREARAALDNAVESASRHRDDALVVARCEYNPSPTCPQTHITGVPGSGPETRTANDFLGDAQRELDHAVAERDRLAPALDPEIAGNEQALAQARETAIADADHGLGARWVAMNNYTFASPGAMLLRLVTVAFFVLLSLLPLILKAWRGETTHDRGLASRATVERAELEADAAIAVKRAEVRAAVETMWAEQQLASARLAVEAQTEIDREQQRRRVVEAVDGPVRADSQRVVGPAVEDKALPARSESVAELEPRRAGTSLIPTIPDVTKAAARWIRPFVPPIIASAIDTSTKPLRSARQVFEETEEIHFTLKRTHKMSLHSEESGETASASADTKVEPRWVESSTVVSDHRDELEAHTEAASLRGPDGRRELPSAE
jgi:hypothetical protein